MATASAGDADIRVTHVTVQAQTVAKLRDAILSGVFAPGERLVEATLCARMGVSRTSIREALRRLEAERLITILPNRGPSVALMTWENAKEIYEVRALLEGEAAALCAERVMPEQIVAMKEALTDFEAAVERDSAVDRLESTERFYKVILAGCQNATIAELLQGLMARITFLRARSMSLPGRAKVSALEMRRILTAIAAQKPDAARSAAVEHVRSAGAAARQAFVEQGARVIKPASREQEPARRKRQLARV
ncbi:MAG: GntR family transcriptional regulator [Xanthobacteraceae bacterium]|nr:GntR family transcriptional regulator [Xanthobacteraceae bacterium]